MKNIFLKLQYRLPRMFDIMMDKSEHLRDSPSYRWKIIFKIWNEPINLIKK
jgi:hypothetical protein